MSTISQYSPKDRLAESISEEGDAANPLIGEVVDVFQSIANLLDVVERRPMGWTYRRG